MISFMFDWGSFVTGLLGAVIGGGASLLVQGLSAGRDRRIRRREVVERVGLAFRDLVVVFVTHSKEQRHSKEIFLGLQAASAANTSLRLELTAKEVPVATWVGKGISELGSIAQAFYDAETDERNVEAVTDVVSVVNEELAEWATGRRKADWFRNREFSTAPPLKPEASSSRPEE